MDDLEPDNSEEETAPEPGEEPVVETEAKPAPLADGDEHAVDPSAIALHRLVGMIVAIGVGGAVFLALALVGAIAGIPSGWYAALLGGWGSLAVGCGYLAWRWPVLHHRYLRYRVDTRGVRISRGVLWRTIISIPTTRVQHTDVTQGPLERNYGLATLTVHTAGTRSASIALSGLSHEVALRLRDHLLPGDGDGA